MTEAAQRFPLQWPQHRPRKVSQQRRAGTFTAGGKAISFSAACDRLEDQITRLGGQAPVLSTNVPLRMDGRPKVDTRERIADPGVCVWFTLKGRPLALPCDTFTTPQMNVAAIAEHISALRRQEAYGVATVEESLQAFAALPGPSTIALGGRDRWAVLGIERPRMGSPASRGVIQTAYRKRAKEIGTDDPMALSELNVARDLALQEFPE